MKKIKTNTQKFAKSLTARLTITLFILFAASVNASEYFVATDGVDNIATDNGDIDHPWASLDYALKQVSKGDTINIRGGRYREAIRQGSVSGTAAQPIIIQSYDNEKVTFDGSVAINSIASDKWTHHKDNIYKLPLTEQVWQLFVDDEMMINARWPNARFDDGSVYTRDSWAIGLDATTTNGHIDTDPSVHDLASENIDASKALIIANTRHFDSYTRKVTGHTAGSNIVEHDTTTFFWGSHSYYYLQAALSLLDQKQEWHIDASNNMLYFWAADGKIPSGDIRVRNQQFVIDVNNWNYVTFKGLNFFATTMELTASEAITIEDCNFNYSGASKRALGETTTKASLLRLTNTAGAGAGNFVLRNVSITNSDSQAFLIKGDNTLVENSLFENIDWASTEAYSPSATLVFHGNNTLFRRNTIKNTGTSETVVTAINGSASNSSITAEYNDISKTGFAQSDGSMIQIRIDAQDGTVIHHNWLHDTPKYGFRFDAPIPPPSWGDNGFSHHNVVWSSAGANPKGDNDRHYNNLLFDNTNVDLIILNEKAANGDLSNEFTKTINNVSDSISGDRKNQITPPGVVRSNFNGANETEVLKTLLRDPANHDFRPVEGSSLIDAGEVISDSDFSHPTQGAAPDLGSYENGNNDYWIPGRQLAAASYPIPFHEGSTTKTNADLMWRKAYKAISYNVYFGTAADALTAKGNQINNIFNPGTLVVGQTYYWRVDAITPTTTITGTPWSFSVDALPVVSRFTPAADAYVDDKQADTNKGSEDKIKLITPTMPGGIYEQRFGFLKFAFDVPGTIASATLRLHNAGSKNTGVNVHKVADTSWEESLITWNNQPAMGSSLQQLDIESNTWQEFDVTSALTTEVMTNGLLSLGLKRAALNSRRDVVSKEGAFKPELVIEYFPTVESNNIPVFTVEKFSKENATAELAYSASIAVDATDVDNDTLSFVIVSGPAWLAITRSGSLSGTPGSSDVGANKFIVKVEDGNGGEATATLTITVDLPANNAPKFSAESFSITNATEGTAYSTSILTNVTDAEGDTLTFEKTSGANWLHIAANGDLSGTPLLADIGEQTFGIKVTDSAGGSATATLTITTVAKAIDSGSDGSGSNGSGSDGSGSDGSPTDNTEEDSAGGSIYYMGLLLIVAFIYRRRRINLG